MLEVLRHTASPHLTRRPSGVGRMSHTEHSDITTHVGINTTKNTNTSTQRLHYSIMSQSIQGPSTPIIPSSKAPPPIPRTPSSTLPHPSTGPVPTRTSAVLTRNRPSIYDRNLHRRTGEVALGSFAFLFSEIIQYLQKQSNGIQDLEKRLNGLGYHIGQRTLELVTLREGKSAKRETKILGILQFVYTTIWKTVFGKPADALEKSNENPNEYMIIDNAPLITQFISVPKEMSQLNCAALGAGIIEAVLDGYLFTANVTAHTVETDDHPLRTVFLIKFDPIVLDREPK